MMSITAWLLAVVVSGSTVQTTPSFVSGIATQDECQRLGNDLKNSSPFKPRVAFTCTPYQAIVTVK